MFEAKQHKNQKGVFHSPLAVVEGHHDGHFQSTLSRTLIMKKALCSTVITLDVKIVK